MRRIESTTIHTRKLLNTLAYCAFLIGLDALVVAPLAPAMTDAVHAPANEGGLLVTAYALLYGLSAPLFGPVSDKWGRRKLLRIGLIVFGLGTFATGLSTTFRELLLFRALAGLGGAMTMPTIFALIGDTFPYETRGKAMGIVTGALAGSTVIGVPLGAVFAYIESWQYTFWTVALLVLVAHVITLLGVPADSHDGQVPPPQVSSYLSRFKSAFTQPSVFFALLATFLWSAGLQGMFAYVGVYYQHNFLFNEAQIGFVILAAGITNVIGNVLGGRLSDKVGKRTIVGVASVLAAVGVVSFSLMTHSAAGAILAQVVWSGAIGFGQSPLTALASELSPRVRATVLSLNSSAMYLGMMAATAAAAAILSRDGFVVIGVMCGFASLLVFPTVRFLVKDVATKVA